MKTGTTPGRDPIVLRAPLSRERVISAAIELADADGLAALSMRRLANSLGVEAMSLYYHVKNKNEVLGGSLERVLSELELPLASTPWKQALRTIALSAHAVLDRHRWAAALLMTPGVSSDTQVRWMEGVLAALARAGLPPSLADHAYHALDSYVIGFTLWESSIPYSAAEIEGLAKEFLATMSVDELPHTAEHVRWHLTSSGDEGGRAFEAGLDMFLDGLDMARAGGSGS
ncbi:MAG: TetR/AcrR family transcriptional regulator C-terminal domain-containing protein [Chloroflexota bacterium]